MPSLPERDADFQLFTVDPQQILSDIRKTYEGTFHVRLAPASPGELFCRVITSYFIAIIEKLNYAVNQIIPSRAEGGNLDAIAQMYYIKSRPEPTRAACTVKFRISKAQAGAILIPAGTRVTDTDRTLYWRTQADAYINPGETEKELRVLCDTPGTAGNGWAVGSINTAVDIFDYYTACSNTTESDGGSDSPSDDEFYSQIRASQDAYNTCGAIGAYEYWAKSASTEIAAVTANSPKPCEVYLYAVMKDGNPASEEVKQAMLAACDAATRRPLDDYVHVGDPETVDYNIDLTYYIPSASTQGSEEIEAAVEKAVSDYVAWQSGALGRDINPSELYGRIMQTGVKRIELREPAFQILRDGNIFDALEPFTGELSESVPQLAKLGERTVTNGGFEDE